MAGIILEQTSNTTSDDLRVSATDNFETYTHSYKEEKVSIETLNIKVYESISYATSSPIVAEAKYKKFISQENPYYSEEQIIQDSVKVPNSEDTKLILEATKETSLELSQKSDAEYLAKRVARLAVVQSLYQMDVASTDADSVKSYMQNEFFKRNEDLYGIIDFAYFGQFFAESSNDLRKFDNEIKSLLHSEMDLRRVSKSVLAIIRACAHEIHMSDLHIGILINEYVEISKAFFDEGNEVSFINGLLNNLAILHNKKQ
jgi:N utilization substance protein B